MVEVLCIPHGFTISREPSSSVVLLLLELGMFISDLWLIWMLANLDRKKRDALRYMDSCAECVQVSDSSKDHAKQISVYFFCSVRYVEFTRKDPIDSFMHTMRVYALFSLMHFSTRCDFNVSRTKILWTHTIILLKYLVPDKGTWHILKRLRNIGVSLYTLFQTLLDIR